MYFEEYGKSENPTIIMLHGAFFTDTYGRQYALSNQYHLIIPHIKGFGKTANDTFVIDDVILELNDFIKSYAPVYLVGFSLGAQLAFKLLAESPELFKKAIIVSPWLVNKDEITDDVMNGNLKMLSQLKNRILCRMIGISSGMPKQKITEMVDSMQNITEQTVRNCVDNKISFDTVNGFEECEVPVLALAGKSEPEDIQNSVKRMADLNKYCTCEIWAKAKHNIPTAFAKKFNQSIISFFDY